MTKKEAFEKIKTLLFGEQKMYDAKLVDGTIVQWEGELAEGTAIMVVAEDGNTIPAPDAVHELADGTKITTVGGLITAIESKEVEAQLLKVQSAMALAEGLQSLGGLKDSMIALGSVIKNQVVTAFATLKGALMATGIGLVIAAIGTAIYLMDKYNDEIEDNIQKQKRLNEEKIMLKVFLRKSIIL
jgi:hypothetical protein